MIKNGFYIQTISTKRTDLQINLVFLLRQVTEKKEKAKPAYFLKFLLTSLISGTFGFNPSHKANASAKTKEPLLALTALDFLSKGQFILKNKT